MPLVTPQRGITAFPSHAIAVDTFGTLGGAQGYTSSGTYPTADLAIYIPVRVVVSVTVLKIHIGTGTASGNLDVGLYSSTGSRLVSSGTTAITGTGQTVDVTDTSIGRGLYYIAITVDNTTATFARYAPGSVPTPGFGVLVQQLSASGTLPTTATWTNAFVLSFVPYLALLLEGTVA
jgi:hypothetical protein